MLYRVTVWTFRGGYVDFRDPWDDAQVIAMAEVIVRSRPTSSILIEPWEEEDHRYRFQGGT